MSDCINERECDNIIATAKHLGIRNYENMRIGDIQAEIAKKLGIPFSAPEPEVCNEYDCTITFERRDGKTMGTKDDWNIRNFLKKNMSVNTSRKQIRVLLGGEIAPERQFTYPFTVFIKF